MSLRKNKNNKKVVKLSRKQQRKEQRKQKKIRKNEYFTNKRKPGKFVLNPDKIVEKEKTKISPKVTNSNNKKPLMSTEELRKKEKEQQKKLQKKMEKHRIQQLIDANADEDLNIKHLEKQLKLNKRKTKGLPKSFAEDGLDYILEVCDPETIKGAAAVEQQLYEANDNFEEDLALMTGHEANTESNDDSEENLEEEEEEDILNNEEENESDNDSSNNEDSDNDECDPKNDNKRKINEKNIKPAKKAKVTSFDGNSTEDFSGDNEEIEKDEKNEIWVDIYGRKRNKDGEVLEEKSIGKYIPPALKVKTEIDSEDKRRQEKLNRLKKQLKGLFNRLAESNMYSISTQIEELFMNNSRNDMNDTITKLIFDSLITPLISPERLLMEHVMLITILHANVGEEVGANFLQNVIKKFDEIFNEKNQCMENKTMDNVVNVLAQMYNFKIFDCKLMYEILDKLASEFNEKNIDCILLILKNVGFTLRKDDPLALKNFILNAQKQAANASEELKNNARVKFMLDILLAIKNNNVSKIPNYDVMYSEHLKKILKSFMKNGKYVTQLNISLEDLLKVEEKGRWWVIGSAWSGNIKESHETSNENKKCTFAQKLLDLAKKQRMNTDTRRNIFCTLMSAEDYLDAYEKLIRLGLKNQQEREIIHVILHCCLQEKKYNPYYSFLTQKLCEDNRRFKMTVKYSIWDKLKTLNEHSGMQISNLAKLLTHLFIEQSLPITTLKIIQFSDMDKVTLRFIRQILLGILLHENLEVIQNVFDKVALSDKLKMFRESLRLFIHHFLLKNLVSDSISKENRELIETRAKIVEKLLSAKDKLRF